MTRLEKIAAMLRQRELDAMLITGEENLCYATGFVGLEGMVFITAAGKGWCFTDSRYIEAATAAVAPLGYTVIQPERGYAQTAQELVLEQDIGTLGFEDRVMTYDAYQTYAAAIGCQLVPVKDAFEVLREVKEQAEVDCIVAAQRIAEAALERLLPHIRPGAVETELAAELEHQMRLLGSTGVSFPTILVSGAKSSLPHGTPGDKKIAYGDFVTIDFGAMVGGYHSDMTRTFAVGSATDEMKLVYDTVLRAQLAGIEALEVGVAGCDVDKAARDIIEQAGYGKYFGHGLGHSLGLNIHESPRASRFWPHPFKEGNIITIEPGIYLPGKFGVRIEDMVYLSADGKVNLTNAPKNLQIL